jgi:hypothetical protein
LINAYAPPLAHALHPALPPPPGSRSCSTQRCSCLSPSAPPIGASRDSTAPLPAFLVFGYDAKRRSIDDACRPRRTRAAPVRSDVRARSRRYPPCVWRSSLAGPWRAEPRPVVAGAEPLSVATPIEVVEIEQLRRSARRVGPAVSGTGTSTAGSTFSVTKRSGSYSFGRGSREVHHAPPGGDSCTVTWLPVPRGCAAMIAATTAPMSSVGLGVTYAITSVSSPTGSPPSQERGASTTRRTQAVMLSVVGVLPLGGRSLTARDSSMRGDSRIEATTRMVGASGATRAR